MTRLVQAAVLALVLLRPARLWAQCNGGSSCSFAVNLQFPVPYLARLLINGGSSASTTLDPTTAAALTQGYQSQIGPKIEVSSNMPYRVEMQTFAANWTYTGTLSGSAKPASDLQWSTTLTGTYLSADVSRGVLPLSGNAAATPNASQQVYYRILWAWDRARPGTYTIPVTFTLTAP